MSNGNATDVGDNGVIDRREGYRKESQYTGAGKTAYSNSLQHAVITAFRRREGTRFLFHCV